VRHWLVTTGFHWRLVFGWPASLVRAVAVVVSCCWLFACGDEPGRAARLVLDLSPLPAMLLHHRFRVHAFAPEMATIVSGGPQRPTGDPAL
jgi:hypothetical protein